MKIYIFFLIIIVNFSLYSQKNSSDTIYVTMDIAKNKYLFAFEKDKKNKYANIKVFNYNNHIVDKKGKNVKNDLKIYPKPIIYNYYDYHSIHIPKQVTSIKKLKTLTIEDFSKNQNKITNNHIIIFIEKLSDLTYNLWPMKLSYQE